MNAPPDSAETTILGHHISVIGLGAMGGGIARALLHSTFCRTVTGYDRDVALVNAFYRESLSLRKGHLAKIANADDAIGESFSKPPTSLDEAIFVDTNFVLLVLLNEKQCDDVCFGSDGAPTSNPIAIHSDGLPSKTSRNSLISILPNDCCVVCCSTVSPGWAERASEKFRNEARKHNNRHISFVDCPISGGPTRARMGTLTVMPSSDERVAIEKAMPLFSAMSKTSVTEGSIHIIDGGAGRGSMVKMVHQLLAGIHICAAAEALALAAKAGLDVQQVYQIVNGAAGASWMFKDRGQRMISCRESEVKSALSIFVKDLDIVYNEAKRLHSPIPLANTALQQFIIGQGLGLSNSDDSAVVKVYEKINGAKVGRVAPISMSDAENRLNRWVMDDGSVEAIVDVGCEPRHNVVLKNEYVRVLHVSFPPNDTTLAHRHSEDSIYLFLVEVDGGGRLNVVNHVQGMAPCCDFMDFGEVRYGAHKTETPLVHKITNKSEQDMLCIDAEILRCPPVTAVVPLIADKHELIKTRAKCRIYKLNLEPGEEITVTYPFFHLSVTLRGGTLQYEAGSDLRWTETKKLSDVEWNAPVWNMKVSNVGLTSFEQFIVEWR
jgi:L-threonate 2-dehydrogenase